MDQSEIRTYIADEFLGNSEYNFIVFERNTVSSRVKEGKTFEKLQAAMDYMKESLEVGLDAVNEDNFETQENGLPSMIVNIPDSDKKITLIVSKN